ncbi:MAG: hypothetical protein LBH54_04625 [Clostridiales bacterium]|jgi:hypothetical protein|nr:hypothetical protein [Clostridiales bacterium]
MSVIDMWILHEAKDPAWLLSTAEKPMFTGISGSDPSLSAVIPNLPITAASRHLDVDSVKGISNADLTQAFSFDKTNDRLVGFSFNVNSQPTPYTAEFEVYYVTPNIVDLVSELPSYAVVPGNTISTVKAKTLDVDGDEILDSEFTQYVYTTDAQNAEVHPATGVLTIKEGFSGEETFHVTATSAAAGYTSLSDTVEITITDASDPNVPTGVDISAQPLYELANGGTITPSGGVMNSAGNLIDDDEIQGGIAWSMTTACPQLSMNAATGVITANGELRDPYSVTVTAAYEAYTDSVTFTVKSDKKSLNYNLGATGEGNWGTAGGVSAMTDGNTTTTIGGGNHSASNWRWYFQPKDAGTFTYNKVVIRYTQYNTEYIILTTGTSVGSDFVAENGQSITKDLGYTYLTENPPMVQAFMLDGTNDSYIAIDNKYQIANAAGETNNKYAIVSEVEVYHVTPARVVLNAQDAYFAQEGAEIPLSADIVDVDGDAILDNAYAGLHWTLTGGGTKASVNAATGVITVNGAITAPLTVTVKAEMTANGYNGWYDEREITLTGKRVGAVEIIDIPDFIMTNAEQVSTATFWPSAVAYGFDGAPLAEQPNFAWSLASPVAGVSVNDDGSFTVAGSAGVGEMTLIASVADAGEDASASVTVKLNEKVDYVKNKIGWSTSGWGGLPGSPVSRAVDGDPETLWDSGGHNPGTALALFDLGGTVKANFFRAKIGTIGNSEVFRIASSDTLESSVNGVAMNPPTAPNTAPVSNQAPGAPFLAPRGNGGHYQGKTLWSGYTAGNENATYANLGMQDNILTSTEVSGYFKTGMTEMKYVGILNLLKVHTDTAGKFTVSDFEVYNTAPNYVTVDLPASVDVSADGAAVPMRATLYNGAAAETKTGAGAWSVSGAIPATIDPQSGVLTVSKGTAFAFGAVTYTYESDMLDADATVYVCVNNGVLEFSNVPTEFLDFTFANGIVPVESTLYVPEEIDAADVASGIGGAGGELEVYVVDESSGEIEIVENGDMLEQYKVYIIYNDFIFIYSVRYATAEISVAKDGTTATAAVLVKPDLPEATLLLAEYTAEGKLARVMSDVKASDEETLSVTLSNVGAGNTVKALLVDSLGGIRPLRNMKTLP